MRFIDFWARLTELEWTFFARVIREVLQKRNNDSCGKCEVADSSKRWFAEYDDESERQSIFNFIQALASEAEREIIFISFRTSRNHFVDCPPPFRFLPSLSLLFFSPPSAAPRVEPRARIIRYRVGPSLMN